MFCTNGGMCITTSDGRSKCNCPTGYTGPHCEFQVDSVPPCSLECDNGGECQLGIQTYEEAHEVFDVETEQISTTTEKNRQDHINFMHCSCPNNNDDESDVSYGGVQCKVQTKSCTHGVCYHGGGCTKNGFCDCRTASTAQTKGYAGLHCQYPASVYCTDNGPNSLSINTNHNNHHRANNKHFCVNGGRCPVLSHQPCICPRGLHGTHCEYTTAEVEAGRMPNCDLRCQNGGYCRMGTKDLSIPSKSGLTATSNVTHDGNFRHCACPEGYGGILCEIEITACGNGVCLHGATCDQSVPTKTQDVQQVTLQCDCTKARSSGNMIKYAGKSCEYPSTSLCVKDEAMHGATTQSFCVNHGKCKVLLENDDGGGAELHGGCICPDGFFGDYCERSSSDAGSTTGTSSTGATTTNNNSSNSEKKSLGVKNAFILFAAVSFTLGFIWFVLLIVSRHIRDIETSFVEDGDDVLHMDNFPDEDVLRDIEIT